MGESVVCQICGGAIPKDIAIYGHTALCAAVISVQLAAARAELASTGWLLLGCALALDQIRAGVGQLSENVEAAWYYALIIAERACEDLHEATGGGDG